MQTSANQRLSWAVGLLSASVLAFEITLMRILLVASWHHFAFLVITMALLGFGASGTLLFLLRPAIMRRPTAWFFALSVATALAMPLCIAAAQQLPVEARLLPALLARQIAWWLLYWALLALPFLAGASAIGVALMAAGHRIPRVYAANLFGSGAGAIAATLAMAWLTPQWLPLACALLAAGAATLLPGITFHRKLLCLAAPMAVIIAALLAWPQARQIRTDPLKYSSYLARLQRQGSARPVAEVFTPRSHVQLWRSDAFHELSFLAGGTPPPMDALVVDGHWAGSVLRATDPAEARILDRTLMAFGYDLASPRPRVLLLGDSGGTGAWLAAARGAAQIDWVQPDPGVIALLACTPSAGASSPTPVLQLPGLRVHRAELRHFIDHAPARYDLIHLAHLEGSGAGSGGMAGLGEDHLVTVEGIHACLSRLSPDGLLMVCRGIQTPPRDVPKLLGTFIAALRRQGIARPEQHLVLVRDYLGVCILVKPSPWTPGQIARVRQAVERRELTPVWFSGIRPQELNQPDELPGPDGSPGDWYYAAVQALSSPDRQEARSFLESWAFDIRPATDDRPFFRDFCRLRSVAAIRQAYGNLWLTRVELAFLFVLSAIVLVTPLAAACILLPLLLLRFLARRQRPTRGRSATAAYFAAIGAGYMLLEITLLSRLTLLVGDAVQTAAVTVASFLLFSGLGSLAAQRMRLAGPRTIARIVASLLAVATLQMLTLAPMSASAGGFPAAARFLAAAAFIAPAASLMGFLMPLALARLEGAEPALIPFAWAVNGFASVLATPLATALSMTAGFTLTSALALVSYAGAALAFPALPAPPPGRDRADGFETWA